MHGSLVNSLEAKPGLIVNQCSGVLAACTRSVEPSATRIKIIDQTKSYLDSH